MYDNSRKFEISIAIAKAYITESGVFNAQNSRLAIATYQYLIDQISMILIFYLAKPPCYQE